MQSNNEGLTIEGLEGAIMSGVQSLPGWQAIDTTVTRQEQAELEEEVDAIMELLPQLQQLSLVSSVRFVDILLKLAKFPRTEVKSFLKSNLNVVELRLLRGVLESNLAEAKGESRLN